MVKIKSLISFVFTVALTVSFAFAQKGIEDGSKYGHGEDSISCIKNISLYREYVKNRNYEMALPFWRVPFNECPKASKNIYIDGVKIYSYMQKKEKDALKKDAYVDSIMLVYDNRIKYTGKKGYVRGRQGVDLLRLADENMDRVQQAYDYLAESIELREDKSAEAAVASYVTASVLLYKNGLIEGAKVVEDYALASEILDAELAKNANDKNAIQAKEMIDQNFGSSGAGSCEDLVSIFGQKYNENKADIDALKNITKILDKSKCTGTELFLNASKSLHELEPSAYSASNIAKLSVDKGDFKTAYDYFKKAIELEEDAGKKADYYYGLAIVTGKLDKPAEARGYAYKAAELKPDWGEPYILIGNLYADSKDACSSIELPQAVYWAAVDKFVKAKAVDATIADKADKLIQTYSQYYPNKEQAFFLNITDGSEYKIGCWINETTKARF